jgi:hypothetical protein
VQSVVVNENADGPLHRKQVRRVIDRVLEFVPSPLRQMSGGGSLSRDDHATSRPWGDCSIR